MQATANYVAPDVMSLVHESLTLIMKQLPPLSLKMCCAKV